ncbi:putative polynucleotide adenylyltransferase [Lupinus albus]|uniref:Putative polynucleotide adenylyltransferase n=1 Tax=Lupinus albus TaxID=3870 RepID=A0A6A4NWR6_LUPAL|nr:putative polynucleotide adenylyltransferase [Lupinus albus]
MEEHDEILLNGLLPDEAATTSVMRVLDTEQWLKAEERTAELIACIQPNQPSEERRNAVADYVQRLIARCFPCQVFTFGSVPLKTYLPDGDIDLTAFSKDQSIKDAWAHQVCDMLKNEEKDENAEFRVREVQYIQAEVKIIKCLVENIVVDISFNQLGGLCTLCFLEEIDNLINQNHLFKRSIMLIKAWCYYESRLLGAHHGLISTYALETLVLYIFHVFNNSFAGPLEVLYRFLEFFSKFDWENFCVSLWGPVPINSLPDVTADPPRKDGGDLLLSKLFLDACSSVYAVFPAGHENQGQPFVSKYFNVIDPLRVNNNLGRSVGKGNFLRIRSAFALGAKQLARLLDCPKEELFSEINQFFMNTWKRHGNGERPDAPNDDLWHLRLSSHDQLPGSENSRDNSQKINNTSICEIQVEGAHSLQSGLSHHSNLSPEISCKSNDVSTVSHALQSGLSHQNNASPSDQVVRESTCNQGANVDKVQRNVKLDNPFGDVPGRFLFARTHSSPELTRLYGEVFSRGRQTRAPESGKNSNSSAMVESNHTNVDSDMAASNGVRVVDSSAKPNLSHQVIDISTNSNNSSSSYHDESVQGIIGEKFASIAGAAGTHMMNQEEQDLLNMMTYVTAHGFTGQPNIPVNFALEHHLQLPFSPSILASMGYAQRNIGNLHLVEAPWGNNMQLPHGLVPSPLSPCFPGIGLTSYAEDLIETGNENFSPVEPSLVEADNDFWHEQSRPSSSGVEVDDENFQMLPHDKQESTSGIYNFAPPSHVGSSSSSCRHQQKFAEDYQGSIREERIDTSQYPNGKGNDVYFDDKVANSRLTSTLPSSCHGCKTSSESSWEVSSAKSSKSTREKRGRTNTPPVPSYGKGKKNVLEISSNSVHDENRQQTYPKTLTLGVPERSTRLLMHVPRQQVSSFEAAQTSGSDSVLPIGPMLIGHGSRQRAIDNNSGVGPFAFCPAGPPVPFLTMLPLYNLPPKASSATSPSNFNVEEVVYNADSGQNFDVSEIYDHHPEVLLSPAESMRRASFDSSEPNPDILKSDFISHLQNLQFGRFCQNSRHPQPVIHPSHVMVPPVYLQGRFPWDGPGRPVSVNMNIFTQLMSHGPRLVHVAPLHPVSNRPANVSPRLADEMPRYRSGTGTYLPNPASVRDLHSTSTRKGNYNYDRSDNHGDREGNSDTNSKLRTTGRGQIDKSSSRPERLATSESHTERPWGSHTNDSIISHQNENSPVHLNSMQDRPANVAYGMYSLPSMNYGGLSSDGPTIPSVVMLYPYDHNADYSSPTEQLEFGSLGSPMGFSGVHELNEGSHSGRALKERRFHHGGSSQQPSPDQPSSPHVPRGL